MRNCPSPRQQAGSTLTISLIILIILMLLGVTAMIVSDTQYKLAGNLQFEDAALNNAETAIAIAENWLVSDNNTRNPGFDTYNPNGNTPHLYPSNYNNDVLNMTWDDRNSLKVCINGECNPTQRYIIEKVSSHNNMAGSNVALGGRSSSFGCNQADVYRITARGTSARGATRFVQTHFSVLSCN